MPRSPVACPLLAVALLAVTSLGCLRPHDQLPGHYALTAVGAPLQDRCDLLSQPGFVQGLDLHLSGDILRFQSDYFSVSLIGQFRSSQETFYADGSSQNVTPVIGGEACLVDQLAIHLDGATEDANTFTGTARVEFQTTHVERCDCKLWTEYRAVLQSP